MKIMIVLFVAMFTLIGCGKETTASDYQQTAITMLKKHEGFRGAVYTCPAGKLTIGYGFTSKVHTDKKTMTEKEASEILDGYVKSIDSYLDTVVKVELTGNQRAALISFIYNVGQSNFEESTLLKKLNNREYGAVPAEMKRWVYAKKKVLPGLVKRRAEEAALFSR